MPWGWAGKEVMWDQHIFNDVVETFAWGKHIERRSGRCLIENAKRDAWERERGYPAYFGDGAIGDGWTAEVVTISAEDIENAGGLDVTVGQHTVHAAPFKNYFPGVNASATTTTTTTTTEEKVIAAPAWLFAGWDGAAGEGDALLGAFGWWTAKKPKIAIAHFVGGLGKQTTMKALGWWTYGSEVYKNWKTTATREAFDERGAGALAVTGLLPGSREDNPDAAVNAFGE